MGGWQHRLSKISIKTRMATCGECGRVAIVLKGSRWKCRVAARRQKGGNPDTARRSRRRRDWLKRYGLAIDFDAADLLLEKQGGRCGICGAEIAGPGPGNIKHLDHDHATGRLRGWLCSRCNRGIGLLGDDPELLRRAVAYLAAP